ncbi:MAG: hypothetical protein IJ327_01020, partial [Lachnospiraceae bacterium]|nr:hypothetical protein [Lachnospiraceae bacterium]
MEWEENSFVPQDEPQKGKKKTHLTILAGVLLAMALIGAGIFVTPYLMPVEQMAGRFTYELGQTVSREIEDYVIGRSWATDKCVLDLTQVREYEVGEYPVTVRHGFQRFDYVIRIQDTIAPVLTLQGGPYVLEVGEDYGVDFFDIEARDNSTQISWGIVDADGAGDLGDAHLYEETLSYDTIGYHRVAVSARDASGNISWIELDVLVDDGPEITGVMDFYLAVGERPDY